MKKVIFLLFVAAKMYSQSPAKFETSESFTINVNSDMAINAGIGTNINSKEKLPLISSGSGKTALYTKLMNSVFYNGENVNEFFSNTTKNTIVFNVESAGKKQTIEKLYFDLSDNDVKLVKSETLVIINEKF
jgi:hypothetical protein